MTLATTLPHGTPHAFEKNMSDRFFVISVPIRQHLQWGTTEALPPVFVCEPIDSFTFLDDGDFFRGTRVLGKQCTRSFPHGTLGYRFVVGIQHTGSKTSVVITTELFWTEKIRINGVLREIRMTDHDVDGHLDELDDPDESVTNGNLFSAAQKAFQSALIACGLATVDSIKKAGL